MQTLSWYYRRLRGMPPREIAWRVRSVARDLVDAGRVRLGWRPSAGVARELAEIRPHVPARLSPEPVGALAGSALPEARAWLATLTAEADAVLAHRLSFFDLEDVGLGDPIAWHRDHNLGRTAPPTAIQFLDYRDVARYGDCKLVWEPNRHHQLVVLARAYRATGRGEYAAGLVAQMLDWIEANPFGYGMNWRSPLELGVRLINWVWALDMIGDAPELAPHRERILATVYDHCVELSRKLSQGSSANNHLIGEAAGLFVAACYFPALPGATAWRRETATILEREITAQTYPCGCTREHAFGYQLFVAQLELAALLAAERCQEPLSDGFKARLAGMIGFVAELTAAGPLPNVGDADSGYVLALGEPVADVDVWLEIAALAFGSPLESKRQRPVTQSVYWLFGEAAAAELATRLPAAERALGSRAFEDAGYYLLQTGHAGARDATSLLFDCAELGYGSLAAHGHADALSVTLRVAGLDFLVDSGTYDYFSYPQWRRYFRSTAAHNTVRIDGADQSEMQGPFLWGTRAAAKRLRWHDASDATEISGEHDGYRRLAQPVTHRRTIRLDKSARRIEIVDELEGEGRHDVEVFFHLASKCRVQVHDAHTYVLEREGIEVRLALDAALDSEISTSRDGEPFGWVSPGYHRKEAAQTIVGRVNRATPLALTTSIRLP